MGAPGLENGRRSRARARAAIPRRANLKRQNDIARKIRPPTQNRRLGCSGGVSLRARVCGCHAPVEATADPNDEGTAKGAKWDETGGQMVNARESGGGRFAPEKVNERNHARK